MSSYLAAHEAATKSATVRGAKAANASEPTRSSRSDGMPLTVRLLLVLLIPKESYWCAGTWPLVRLLLMKLLFVQPKARVQLSATEGKRQLDRLLLVQLAAKENGCSYSCPLQSPHPGRALSKKSDSR